MILDAFSIIFISAGLLFFLGAVIGIVRFPDFYTRMHAAAKGDTLSSLLILVGLGLYSLHDFSIGDGLIRIKLLFVIGFIFIASPTASHALIDAGYTAKLLPWSKNKVSDEEEEE